MSTLAKPLVPDWAGARRKCSLLPWAKELTAALEKDAVAWSKRNLIPSPSEPSGYTHHYFCQECGEPLVFNPDKPHEHLARACNRIYSGKDYDRAWFSLIHNTNVLHMERCAVLLNLGVQTDLARQEILKFAREYPARYPNYPISDFRHLPGRMMPQSLDEAVWCGSFLRALRWSGLQGDLDASQIEAINVMATMVVDLMRTSIMGKSSIGNITCWMLACMAECALWLDDAELMEWCWASPVGIERQIRFGLNADGLWFEGSTHYHYYALAAIVSYFVAAGADHVPSVLKAKLEAAFTAPLPLAYSDGRLPAYNDCWPDLRVTDNADLYEVAAALLQRDRICSALSAIYEKSSFSKPRTFSRSFNPLLGYSNTNDLTARASVGALLFGPDTLSRAAAPSGSSLLQYSGIVVLRNEHVRLALRFGPYGGGHDHRDKLSVDVETSAGWQSLDVGTSGYGAEITNAWHRSAASHNTVMINGNRQEGCAGRLTHWSDTSIMAQADAAYPGVMLRRTLSLESDAWVDMFHINS